MYKLEFSCFFFSETENLTRSFLFLPTLSCLQWTTRCVVVLRENPFGRPEQREGRAQPVCGVRRTRRTESRRRMLSPSCLSASGRRIRPTASTGHANVTTKQIRTWAQHRAIAASTICNARQLSLSGADHNRHHDFTHCIATERQIANKKLHNTIAYCCSWCRSGTVGATFSCHL